MVLEKAEEPEIKLPTSAGSSKKQESFRKTSISALLTMPNYREPAWGTPPVAKVMRKEAQHTQRRDRASGVPLEILKHLPPKPEPAYLTTLWSHLHLWLYGGLSPTISFGEGVNLELQLIIIPGCDRSVSTYKLLWRFSSLPDRLVRPHVIAHSLPTMRGMRCLNLLKTGSLEKLENY